MALPSGIPIDELDPGIRPQDDLFRHVNGRWLARTEIPADRAGYGSFWILAEEAEIAVRAIVEDAASAPEGSEERKFADLYASFMEADRAELLGSRPVSETLAAARAVSSIPELLETLGRMERLGIGGLYQLFVDTDPGNPQRYLVFLEQAAISPAGRELLPGGAVCWRPRRRSSAMCSACSSWLGCRTPTWRPSECSSWRRRWPGTTGTTSRTATARRLTTSSPGPTPCLSGRICAGGWRPWTRPPAPSRRSCSASRASARGWHLCSPTSAFRRGGTGCAGRSSTAPPGTCPKRSSGRISTSTAAP